MAACASPAQAQERGKLIATAGLIQMEGVGGALAPWALITGYGTRDAVGANVHGTVVRVTNFTLSTLGAAVGLYDRVELSYARQFFDAGGTGRALGLGGGYQFSQDVFSAKLRVFGRAILDQDSWLPQVAVGLQRSADGMLQRSLSDLRIKDKFNDADIERLQGLLLLEFCKLTGGPCRYPGRTMKTAYADLNLAPRHFNAIVEDLQDSMDAEGVPFRTQNRLLAPMHRDIVTPSGAKPETTP